MVPIGLGEAENENWPAVSSSLPHRNGVPAKGPFFLLTAFRVTLSQSKERGTDVPLAPYSWQNPLPWPQVIDSFWALAPGP